MIRRVVLFLLAAILLAGCGNLLSEAEAVEDPVVDDLPPRNPLIDSQPITLKVWLDLDFTRDNTMFDEMVQDFEAV